MRLGLLQQPLVAGTVGSTTRDGLVLIAVRDGPALALSRSFTGAKLVRNRSVPLVLRRVAGIQGNVHRQPPFRLWVPGGILL